MKKIKLFFVNHAEVLIHFHFRNEQGHFGLTTNFADMEVKG